jgi:hypothetical protein
VPRILVACALSLVIASPLHAHQDLTGAVAAAYFPRTVDAGLHAIAHARVVEISACGDCMNHDLLRSGTAEVLGFNVGFANPVAHIVAGWQASASHDGILSDRSLDWIGCAERVVAGNHWYACVLATEPVAVPDPPPPVVTLPDTAMR